jgi:hypothetical protein
MVDIIVFIVLCVILGWLIVAGNNTNHRKY